ncbi:MAG: hypothetical protein R3B48_23080 [Kofleriaceae bacterium]
MKHARGCGILAAIAALAALAATTTTARAEDTDDGSPPGGDASSRPISNRLSLRLGGASTDTVGRPTVCADVRVLGAWSVEACGTGPGLLHNEPGREMAHFRTNFSFFEGAMPRGRGRLRAGLGFAELQVGEDEAGFDFDGPSGARGSVAGPEASLSAQWVVPMIGDFEMLANATAGAAVFRNADQLVEPQGAVHGFVSIELGVGW